MKNTVILFLTVLALLGCAAIPPTPTEKRADGAKTELKELSQFKKHPRYAQYMKLVKSLQKIQVPELPPPDGFIGQGEIWQTPYYFKDSGVEGPSLLIIGGTHGYEIAGWFAAQELINYSPGKGRLFVIPRVNYRGVELKHRFVPGEKDLNRCYPGKSDGGNTEKLAFDVFEFIKERNIQIVLDLHESFDYHLVDESSLGQTIVFYPNDTTAWVSLMASESINETITEPLEKMSVLQGPKTGSTAWAAGKHLSIQGYTLETSIRLPLEKRMDYHIQLVRSILKENEIDIVDTRLGFGN
ncbi:MAG: succinylglutamate desuccinylase/aspartoacylase family protein [Proteobacteria bacterium]|nr:succinylglutamate desuccinylase/aspartoacylase family protein [Pseudomonadota bacterium]